MDQPMRETRRLGLDPHIVPVLRFDRHAETGHDSEVSGDSGTVVLEARRFRVPASRDSGNRKPHDSGNHVI